MGHILQKVKVYFHENCPINKKGTKPKVSKKTLLCQCCGKRPKGEDVVVKVEFVILPQKKKKKIMEYNATESNMAFEMAVFGGKRPEDLSYGYPRT